MEYNYTRTFHLLYNIDSHHAYSCLIPTFTKFYILLILYIINICVCTLFGNSTGFLVVDLIVRSFSHSIVQSLFQLTNH